MKGIKSDNLYIPPGLVWVFIPIILFVWWINIRYGVSCADEPYWLMLSKEPKTYAMGLLSFEMGSAWGTLFGFTFVSFRWFAIFLSTLTYVIMIYPLYRYSRDVALCVLAFMVMTIVKVMPFWTMDSVTHLFCGVSGLMLYYWLRKPRTWLLAVCGAVGAMATLSRLPCLLVLLVDMAAVVVYRLTAKAPLRTVASDLGVLVGAYAVTLWALIALICGSVSGYVDLVTAYSNEEHSAQFVLMEYYRNLFFDFVVPSVCTCGFYGIYRFLRDRVYDHCNRWTARSVLAVLFYFGAVVFCMYINVLNYIHSLRIYVIMLTALSLVCYYTYAHKNGDRRHNTQALLVALIVLCFGAIPRAWSNTGFRCLPIFLFIPFVFMLLMQVRAVKYLRFYVYTLLLVCFVYMAVLLRSHMYYGNPPIKDMDSEVQINGEKFYASGFTTQFVDEVDALRRGYQRQGKSVMLAGGPDRFLLEYMAGHMDNKYDYDEGPNHAGYTDRTIAWLADNPRDVVIVLLTIGHLPPEGGMYEQPTHLEKKLMLNGYRLTNDGGSYRVYQVE